jgi:hypothetical protein
MAISPYDQAALGYKDVLVSGSRTPSDTPRGPDDVLDAYGKIQYRNDRVMAGGVPVISGSSEHNAWLNEGIVPGSRPSAPAGAPAAASASLNLYGTNLQQALQGYLGGVKKPEDVFNTLAALRSVGQLHPNLEQSFLAAGGSGLTPEQIARLKELAAQASLQRGILPSNIG